MKIQFATSNPYKVSESNVVGELFGIEFTQVMGNYPEIRDEDVANVAREGAKHVFNRVGERIIVEDTGLFINELNGFPGSFSSFVFHKIGNRGIIKLLDGFTDRSARFISAIGYCDKNGIRVFEGVAEGTITLESRGSEGFGYDPIFVPKGNELTFAEDPELKNLVSHRRMAFEKLCKWLKKH